MWNSDFSFFPSTFSLDFLPPQEVMQVRFLPPLWAARVNSQPMTDISVSLSPLFCLHGTVNALATVTEFLLDFASSLPSMAF